MSKRNKNPNRPVKLEGKKILLGLTGSIAIYKSCELVRRLRDSGAEVYCAMSGGAQKFISPLLFAALSGHPVQTDIWNRDLWKIAHLETAERSDLFIIAPASANTLARLSAGLADDLLSATVLAVRSPVLIAPAMHEQMYLHPATVRNIKTLQSFGYQFIGPERGELSSGHVGWGRFSNPLAIVQAAVSALNKKA